MNGAEKSKYGHLSDGLSDQYALGNDQYPRTLQAAVDVMRKQKRGKDEVKSEKSSSNNDNNTETSGREKSFAQGVKRCYCCGACLLYTSPSPRDS